MFEILSTIGLTASASVIIGFVAHSMSGTFRGRLTAAAVLTLWFAGVLAIGASTVLDPTRWFGVPALGLTVALPAAALVGMFFAFAPIRASLAATPLPALVAAHTVRILPGILFVILYARGELPAPFAPSAGWGDIFAGVAALPIAWLILRFGPRARLLVFAWSLFGIADLVSAIGLGALSAPGPLQVFPGPPSSAIMTTLPWLIVPGFLVPSLIFIHVVIFHRLARGETALGMHPWLGAGATKLT